MLQLPFYAESRFAAAEPHPRKALPSASAQPHEIRVRPAVSVQRSDKQFSSAHSPSAEIRASRQKNARLRCKGTRIMGSRTAEMWHAARGVNKYAPGQHLPEEANDAHSLQLRMCRSLRLNRFAAAAPRRRRVPRPHLGSHASAAGQPVGVLTILRNSGLQERHVAGLCSAI